MKILFINCGTHHKNMHFILSCKNVKFTVVNSVDEIKSHDLSSFDAVFSPSQPVEVKLYPNVKFIFGPQFSVFPVENQMNVIRGENTIYIQPSEWAAKVWSDNHACDNIKILPMSFGVDTEKFSNNKPITDRNGVFIYLKSRRPDELEFAKKFLESKNICYTIFSYQNRYDENTYLEFLKNSKFGIWLGAHESQGFALEEALSCNVPLLVWNIKSMNQEYSTN